MWLIFMLVAAILAIVVSGLFIGVCLLIAWATDTFRGSQGQRGGPEQRSRGPEQGARGTGGQWPPPRGTGGAWPPAGGTGGAWPPPRGVAEGRHRHASGTPAAYRHGDR